MARRGAESGSTSTRDPSDRGHHLARRCVGEYRRECRDLHGCHAPPQVLLGFTGANGGFTDIHAVSHVVVTSSALPTDPSLGGWIYNGSAVQEGSSLQLTDATTTPQAGSAFWPNPVTADGLAPASPRASVREPVPMDDTDIRRSIRRRHRSRTVWSRTGLFGHRWSRGCLDVSK